LANAFRLCCKRRDFPGRERHPVYPRASVLYTNTLLYSAWINSGIGHILYVTATQDSAPDGVLHRYSHGLVAIGLHNYRGVALGRVIRRRGCRRHDDSGSCQHEGADPAGTPTERRHPNLHGSLGLAGRKPLPPPHLVVKLSCRSSDYVV
jgi:hypothetical protein